jgi:RNA polymerase-binding transcription factor DksA
MVANSDSLTAVRERLLARREELRRRLGRLSADQRRAAEALSADAPDRAIQQENDEVVDSLGVAADAELREVDAALMRIDAGTYGRCVSCGFAIEPKRLAAVPYAVRCSRCTSDSDQNPC